MNISLADLGLTPFFTQQLSAEESEGDALARIVEVQRSGVIVADGIIETEITPGSSWFQKSAEHRPTVGDWVIVDDERHKIVRLLERKSLFSRMAVGGKDGMQAIAANVDTLFIVSSCNEEFNESRLERYLALAVEAGVDPVVVVSKTDLAVDANIYADRVRAVKPGVPVEMISALDVASLAGVKAWINRGSTVALVGSSGVGKSTIVNSLSGTELAGTGGIRQDDAKGRHTTTYRALHRLSGGGLLLDVPGMRELGVANLDAAIGEVFEDIDALATSCRFGNCTHGTEVGCAVQQALAEGRLTERRLANFRKLMRENVRHTNSLAQQRRQDKKFSRTVRQHVKAKRG